MFQSFNEFTHASVAGCQVASSETGLFLDFFFIWEEMFANKIETSGML